MSYTGTLTVPYRFVTIFIIAHGEDIKVTTLESVFGTSAKKHYKLTVSGLTGNITNGSGTVDAIYSQTPRILAHDRTMSPLQKLYVVHNKMHSDFYFKDEVEDQSQGQRDHVLEQREYNLYQRPQSRNENWFPEPTLITYDRAYSFNANPIKNGDRCRDAMERNEFGVWLLDASLDIATVLRFRPGCETEPLSLLTMLEINLSTARTHQSSDESGATRTRLFIIMRKLMEQFGDDIHINVVDVGCRYFNWDKYRPAAKKKHNFGSGLQTVGDWVAKNVLESAGTPLLDAGKYFADEVPSESATELANEYQPERVVSLDGRQSLLVEKWYSDGNIKLSTLPNVWEMEGSLVTSTEKPSTDYNLVTFSIGPHVQTIDTTTLFEDNIRDRIVNGSSLETTHDIEVFHVLRKSPKIIVTLKRKPAMKGIESWLPGDHDTDTNAYLTLVSLNPITGIRQWTIDSESALFFKQVYDTVVRIEAATGSKLLDPTTRKRNRNGGRKKQKKRRTRRLRVKTNKSKKTRLRYSTSYRR